MAMLSTIFAILPVFALILAGFVCRRTGILGPNTSSELNRFVVFLALPALLFHVTATADWARLWQPGFIASFSLGCLAVFVATLAVRVRRGRPLGDASIDGLNAAYANTGYMGFPLCQLVFGRDSLALVTIATILTACVLFALAVVLVEVGLQAEARPHRVALKVAVALGRNPLVAAPALGALWAGTGVPLPGSIDAALTLLGAAASPCALVSLGLFLAARRDAGARSRPSALGLTALKLVVQPAVTALLAYGLFGLAPGVAAIVVVLSALPTGTGPFMVAEFYRRDAEVTSTTILFSTVGSILTLTLCLLLTGARAG